MTAACGATATSNITKRTNEMNQPRDSIEVWEYKGQNGAVESRYRRIKVAACPFCASLENCVCDVPNNNIAAPPSGLTPAVHCAGCGCVGPWAQTEEQAVLAWNKHAGVGLEVVSDWAVARAVDDPAASDLPF